VRVPSRLADDAAEGFSLLEDLGPRTLYERSELDWDGRAPFYEDALAAARRIAALPAGSVVALGSPPLDPPLLRRELEAFERLFLDAHGLRSEAFAAALGELCSRLGDDERLPCHRDLMVRNLMPLPGGRVALLDFQDLRLGPPAYDLASLLNDSWFPPAALERRWVELALPPGVAFAQYRRAVVQRTLKAIGTFLSFAARGGPRHLPLVAPTLARAIPHLAELPETAASFAPLAPAFLERASRQAVG
jgi:aminoglycoside/choline kinase family phosphotransferase